MVLTKKWVLDILETMPESFSADSFIDKIISSKKLEVASDEVNNNEALSNKQAEAHTKLVKNK